MSAPAAPTNEAGFGLIELLIAMVILNVALLAIVGAFASSGAGVARAGRMGTAGAIVDRQLEQYRTMLYGSIGFTTTGTIDSLYLADSLGCPAHNNGNPPCNEFSIASCPTPFAQSTGASGPDPCKLVQTYTGPDGHRYRIDTYIWRTAATASQRATKTALVVVRDDVATGKPELTRGSSTFDCSTGGGSQLNVGNADC